MSPQNLTPEQRAWVKAIALDAARHVQRRSTVGFIILLVGLATVLWLGEHHASSARKAIIDTGRIISVDGCNRDFKSRQEIREVLLRSKEFQDGALERGDITKSEYQRAIEFYDERLEALPLPDCRKSETILSDDPDEVPAKPTPLYPEE